MPDEASSADFARHPGEFITLGRSMVASGKGDKALALVAQVLAANPGDLRLRSAAEAILTDKIPGFHRNMLADQRRNEAFRRAIESAGLKGKSVLDIGAGSGLLAMMAARAGAARVYACEANEAIAATAREIIAANGLSETVQILTRHSTALDPLRDLDGGVDFIISEIFSHELIGEGALPSLADAMGRLARPGARVLPASATIRVALADVRGRRVAPIRLVEGFDLSLFDRHSAHASNLATDDERLALRSAPHDLFRFDFQSGRNYPEGQSELLATSEGGQAGGIVQWIRLELADGVDYENEPGSGASHWPAVFHPLGASAQKDSCLSIHGWHDERRLLIWGEPR